MMEFPSIDATRIIPGRTIRTTERDAIRMRNDWLYQQAGLVIAGLGERFETESETLTQENDVGADLWSWKPAVVFELEELDSDGGVTVQVDAHGTGFNLEIEVFRGATSIDSVIVSHGGGYAWSTDDLRLNESDIIDTGGRALIHFEASARGIVNDFSLRVKEPDLG